MDSSQNFGTSYTDCHASESRVQQMHQVALFRTPLADDCALSTTIYECLHWVTVHLHLDVEHGDVSEEFRVVLHGVLVVLLNHVLADFFFDSPLRLSIIRVSVSQPCKSCLLSSLLFKYLFHTFTDYLLCLLIVTCLKRCR